MTEYILASASPRRRELLQKIGMKFTVIASRKEEETDCKIPEEMVQILSRRKAEDILEQGHQNAVVIGADTIVFYRGTVMGKPKDEKEAFHMLHSLQGNIHHVYTGVTICCQKDGKMQSVSFAEKTEVEFYPMTEDEILRYIKTKEPFDKAGGYGIQGCFAAYIKAIRGDYYNVVGLPIGRLYQELKKYGMGGEGYAGI